MEGSGNASSVFNLTNIEDIGKPFGRSALRQKQVDGLAGRRRSAGVSAGVNPPVFDGEGAVCDARWVQEWV
jgi:hypothetical protein